MEIIFKAFLEVVKFLKFINYKFNLLFLIITTFEKYYGAISSVGLEHYLDRVGVTGSNPVLPTKAEY